MKEKTCYLRLTDCITRCSDLLPSWVSCASCLPETESAPWCEDYDCVTCLCSKSETDSCCGTAQCCCLVIR